MLSDWTPFAPIQVLLTNQPRRSAVGQTSVAPRLERGSHSQLALHGSRMQQEMVWVVRSAADRHPREGGREDLTSARAMGRAHRCNHRSFPNPPN